MQINLFGTKKTLFFEHLFSSVIYSSASDGRLAERKIESLIRTLVECNFATSGDFVKLYYMYGNKENKERINLLEEGVSRLPTSGKLWCLLLSCLVQEYPDDVARIKSYLQKAEKEIKVYFLADVFRALFAFSFS